MSLSLTRQWLRQNVAIYPARDRVYADVDAALEATPSVRPKTDVYTYDDGRTQLLLCVHGLLPIVYRNSAYHIPVAVWLPRDYPRDPPIVYVVPTSDMLVKPGSHMDVSGRANVDYLQQWARKGEGCSLLALVQALQAHFSRDPPLYSKPKQQQQQQQQPAVAPPEPGPRPDRPPVLPPKPPSSSVSPPLLQPQTPSASSSSSPSPSISFPHGAPLPPAALLPNGSASASTSAASHTVSPIHVISRHPPPSGRPSDVASALPDATQPALPPKPPFVLPASAAAFLPQPPHSPPHGQQLPSYTLPTHTHAPSHPQAQLLHARSSSVPIAAAAATAAGSPAIVAGPHPPQWDTTTPPPAPAPPVSRPPASGPNPASRRPAPTTPARPPPPPVHAGTHPQAPAPAPVPAPALAALPPPHLAPPPVAPAPLFGPARPTPNFLDAEDDDVGIDAGTAVSATGTATAAAAAAATATAPSPAASAPAPPRPPNPELLRLHEHAHAKLSAELASLAQALALDGERLRAHQRDLLAGAPAIADEQARLAAVRDVCVGVVGRLRDAVRRGEERVEDLKRKGEPPVDELVCSTSIVHNQLVDLVAEDNAIEDTIYHLHRALNAGRIDLDKFLRTTRVLAEEQFMKRALAEKILNALPGGWA